METHEQSAPAPSLNPPTSEDLERLRAHEEAMLDEALAATFPCSDPVSSLCADGV